MFTAKCIVNIEACKEVAKELSKKMKVMYVIIDLLVFAALLYFVALRRPSEFLSNNLINYGMVAVGTIVFTVILFFGARRTQDRIAVRLLEQIKTTYHVDAYEKSISFNEDKIESVGNSDDSREYWYTDIESITETQNLIIFILKGQLYFWINKDTISGGDSAELVQYANAHKNK